MNMLENIIIAYCLGIIIAWLTYFSILIIIGIILFLNHIIPCRFRRKVSMAESIGLTDEEFEIAAKGLSRIIPQTSCNAEEFAKKFIGGIK